MDEMMDEIMGYPKFSDTPQFFWENDWMPRNRSILLRQIHVLWGVTVENRVFFFL